MGLFNLFKKNKNKNNKKNATSYSQNNNVHDLNYLYFLYTQAFSKQNNTTIDINNTTGIVENNLNIWNNVDTQNEQNKLLDDIFIQETLIDNPYSGYSSDISDSYYSPDNSNLYGDFYSSSDSFNDYGGGDW